MQGRYGKMKKSISILIIFVFPFLLFSQESLEDLQSLFPQQIVTGASKHAENPIESPAYVKVIDKETIKRNNFNTLEEIINFAIPGFFINTDRIYQYIGSRGLYFFDDFNTRILILLNGHLLNEPWNNFAGLGREMLPSMDLVERIEVIYGPSSIFYGGYAIYGIINVVTISPEKKGGSELRVSLGSFNTKEFSFYHSFTKFLKEKKFSLLFSFGAYDSKGEDLELNKIELEDGSIWGGRQKGTDYEKAPWLYFYGSFGDFSFQGRLGEMKKGNPTGWYDSNYGDKRAYVKDEKDFFELNYNKSLSSSLSLSFRAFLDYYEFFEKDPYEDSTYILPASNNLYGSEGRINYLFKDHFFSFGFELRKFKVNQGYYFTFLNGEEIPDTRVSIKSKHNFKLFYLQDEWRPSPRITVVLGANYADSKPGGSVLLPRFSFIYKINENFNIKIIASRGYRQPSILESYFYDQDYLQNLDLKAEKITSYELNFNLVPFKKSFLIINFFKNYMKDLISEVEVETEEGNMLQYQNIGKANSKGISFDMENSLKYFKISINGIYQKGESGKNGENLEIFGIPKYIIKANFSYEKNKFFSGISGIWRSSVKPLEEHLDYEGKDLPSSFLFNFNFGYKFYYYLPMSINLKVENLFNSSFKQPTSLALVPYYIPFKGRELFLAYNLKF